jgi:hypothetical protein
LPPHFLAVICSLVRISVLLFWLKEQSNERRVDQVTFDEAARELIRKKLIQHMKKVRIGVPTLAKQSWRKIREMKSRSRCGIGSRMAAHETDRLVALFHSFAGSLTGGIRN